MPTQPYSFWNNAVLSEDAPLSIGSRETAAIMGWGGIRVFERGVDLLSLCIAYAQAFTGYSCGQCIPCSLGSKRLAEGFDHLRTSSITPAEVARLRDLADTIAKSSMCQIGQTTPLALIHVIDTFGERLLQPADSSGDINYASMLTAPCIQACPIHLDIPRYVEEVKMNRFAKALDVICSRLPLPGVVGRVCTRPCESNCRRSLIDEPIRIRHLKRFVADNARENRYAPQHPLANTKELPIAVVGAGPAGLTCAHFLALEGYPVTIFESLPEPGGMAAVGIPDYRLPREILREEVAQIKKLGVKIEYNKALGIDFAIEDLEQHGFKAVFLAMGCHCHKKLGIAGEDKNYEGFIPGIFFLRFANMGEETPKGKKLVVIGGGNVAVDSARMGFRLGFEEVHVVYRRTRAEMPADHVEVRDAMAEGVQFHFLTAPNRIVGESGRVKGLECSRMKLGEPDASGRKRPIPVPDSAFFIDADVLVPTVGQESDFGCLTSLPGVEITKKGTVIIDETFMTHKPGVFAGGDCVSGPDMLIRACAHGRLSGLHMHRFLTAGRSEPFAEQLDERFIAQLKPFDPKEKLQVPSGTPRMPVQHEDAELRKHDFREVDRGFTPEEARKEASRCLRCYRVVVVAYR
ncbi:MAG TPA: FAD-dependent oxidoreductase [Dissulfurispiraceae bacterium]|nr:FAD-dependent oxidoreductase [Dissulfurispiraceae bacterium]